MQLESFILIGAILLFISLVVSKTGYKFGVPALLLFLLIGFVAGQDGLDLLSFGEPLVAQYVGVLALNVILFSGGMGTRIKDIGPITLPGISLATLGVLLTAGISGYFIYWLTNSVIQSVTFTLLESLLLAAVMASTDSASVFSILRSKRLSLKENLKPLLELESGSNDPMAYMLTIMLIQLFDNPDIGASDMVWVFLKQIVLGAVCGIVIGKMSVRMINKINLDNDALYSVLLLTVMFFLYGMTSFLDGNGYLAVYVGGLLLGNHRFVHKRSSLKFFDGLTWLCQIVMFLTLGLLVKPSELWDVAGIGLLIGVFLIVVARPVAVLVSLLPFRGFSFKARVFVSWVGLRGAVPIVFATYPMLSNIEQSGTIFNIVFFITILSLVIQGANVSKMAYWLKLALSTPRKYKLQEFDVEFADDIKSISCEIRVKEELLVNGNQLMDLDLPDSVLIAMVKRNGKYFIPRGNTRLEVGDVILVMADNAEAIQVITERN